MANSIAANALTANALTAPRFAPSAFNQASSANRAPAPRRSLFARVIARMTAARQRQAEAQIARYLATTGGKFTDRVEREILQRLG